MLQVIRNKNYKFVSHPWDYWESTSRLSEVGPNSRHTYGTRTSVARIRDDSVDLKEIHTSAECIKIREGGNEPSESR